MDYELPTDLYSSDDLLRGYDPTSKMGLAESWDFRVFRQYVADGADNPATLDVRRKQADHDANISDALRRFLAQETPKLVGIMGGHELSRAEPAYATVARLARYLTEQGFMIVTGGGPGAMEAAHVGATFAGADDADFAAALFTLGKEPLLPMLDQLVTSDGGIAPGHEKQFDDARRWINASLDAREGAPAKPSLSLGVPTWLYGQEPTTPFATHYAKFFLNSIREETLITNSRAGIVYARGSGGTMREIFEDAERNCYVPDAKSFTPMIFFDEDRYWQRDAEYDANGDLIPSKKGVKVEDTVRNLFTLARARKKDGAACLLKVRFTVDAKEIGDVLRLHSGIALQNLMFALADEPMKVSTSFLSRA